MPNANHSSLKMVFFGTPLLAVWVLEELEKGGILPSLVVTAPDKPAGRKLLFTPSPVKVWAQERGIRILEPEKLDDDFISALKTETYDLFIVAAYGKLIPQEVLDIPKHGVLNVHPSLLPQFRGASPIVTAILSGEKETGTSIMLLDRQMDHGPIVAQEHVDISDVPKASKLGERLARLGGVMLVNLIPKWVLGNLKPREQDHTRATYCGKIAKEDGLINLSDDPEKNYRKIRAFDEWPRAYFFSERKGKKIRVVIKDARLEDGKLVITKVLPEGKREMDYIDFQRNL
ncbi:MAG: methionyl-tRNA formyltransferase [Patescibacteria group bacterium]|nr:methionyl-tRNA formyltransferase [Patescibacteria group bacterium]